MSKEAPNKTNIIGYAVLPVVAISSAYLWARGEPFDINWRGDTYSWANRRLKPTRTKNGARGWKY